MDGNALRGESKLEWAKNNFGEFGFDFDKFSMLLWPMNDAVSAKEIASRINASFPKLASIKVVSPALAHGLDEISALSFDNQATDDLSDNSDSNLSF